VGAMVGGFVAELVGQPPAAFAVIGMAACFGSAARIPIATLLMVTEMTGGYSLLAPAALSVMLAFLVQRQLAANLKYKSLYEGQVPAPSDSPAHRMEHLRTAIKMLGERHLFDPERVGHVNLFALLESGIPVDLPDGKQLWIETISAESPWAGKQISDGTLTDDEKDWEIVALLRDEHLVLPRPSTIMEAKDTVLILTPPERRGELQKHFRTADPAS